MNDERRSHQPLTGIRIIDFTTLLPGPLATLILAEAGAEVIKIERPGGDDMRRLGPRLPDGDSAAFAALSRGKRSITLDLREPAALRQARELIVTADVLVEQNRPGVMGRLGLGYRELAEQNPRLIYCSITGYGQTGPRAQRAGHDLNYVAEAGMLMNVVGENGEPVLPSALLADIGGGALPAALNILLALQQRQRTGKGCHIDVAMADCVLTFQLFAFADILASGRTSGSNNGLLTGGSPRYRLYATSDDRWLAVGALEEKFWQTFCDGIGLPQPLRDDSVDPRATAAAVAGLLRQETAAEWVHRFEGRDACVSLVRNFDEAIAEPGWQARGVFDWKLGALSPSGKALPALPLPVHRAFRQSPTADAEDDRPDKAAS